jgi:hypothetical protein
MPVNNIDELAVILTARIDEFEKNMEKAGRVAGKTGADVAAANKGMSAGFLASATAIGALTAGITAFVKGAAGGAAQAQQLEIALSNTAKNAGMSQQAVDQYVKSLEGLSMSHREALQWAAMFGKMGYDQAQSIQLIKTAQDMAASSGRDWSGVLQDIMHAVNYQRPGLLRMYGVTGDLDDIFARFGSTLGKTGKQLSFMEKRQAILAEIMSNGAKYSGAFAARMETLAGASDNFNDELKNVTGEFGKAFLPTMTKALKIGTELLRWFQSLSPAVKNTVTGVAAMVASVGVMVPLLGGAALAFGKVAASMKALQLAMVSNPFTAATAALLLALPLLDRFLDKMDKAIEKSSALKGEEAAAAGFDFRSIQQMQPERRYKMGTARLRFVDSEMGRGDLTDTARAKLSGEQTMLRDSLKIWEGDAAKASAEAAKKAGKKAGQSYAGGVNDEIAKQNAQIASMMANSLASPLAEWISSFGKASISIQSIFQDMLKRMVAMFLESGLTKMLSGVLGGATPALGALGPVGIGIGIGGAVLGGLLGFDSGYNDAMAKAAGGKWFNDAMRNFSDGYVSQALGRGPENGKTLSNVYPSSGPTVVNLTYNSSPFLSRGTPLERRRAAEDMGRTLERRAVS